MKSESGGTPAAPAQALHPGGRQDAVPRAPAGVDKGQITVRPVTKGDALHWDRFVAAHAQGTPYHAFAWGQALAHGYGLRTLYHLAEDAAGRVLGIAPVAQLPHPLGGQRGALCGLPYCDRGEVLAGDATVRTALIQAVLQAGDAGDRDCYLEQRGCARAPTGNATPQAGQKVRMLLPLPDSSEALFAGFKSKHRSQINKAIKNGLTVELGNSAAHVRAFYRVYCRNMRDLGSPPHSLRWFRAVAEAYGAHCLLALVAHAGSTIGAGLVLLHERRACIPWASTLREHNRLAPNMLLYWALLEAVTQRGCSEFDFGRSSYGEGTYRFKAQWGAQPVPLEWSRYRLQGLGTQAAIHCTPLASTAPDTAATSTAVQALGQRLRGAAESTWQRLPLPLTVAAGARLRPFISL